MSAANWLLIIVLLGICGQVGFILWARRRYDRSIGDAERQASKRRAELIDKAYDKLHGDSHE